MFLLSNAQTKRQENTKIGMQVRVHQNFLQKLVLNSQRHHSGVTAIYSKNDVIFAITLHAGQI